MKCKDYITDRKEVTDLALDKDLQSIQEVRDLIAKAKDAERILSTFSQEKLDAICEAVAEACMVHGTELAGQAARETGFGNAEDKAIKNRLGSQITWESIRDMKVVGML